jgi:hypothetical protein
MWVVRRGRVPFYSFAPDVGKHGPARVAVSPGWSRRFAWPIGQRRRAPTVWHLGQALSPANWCCSYPAGGSSKTAAFHCLLPIDALRSDETADNGSETANLPMPTGHAMLKGPKS